MTNVTGDMAGTWGCQLTNTRGQGSSEVRVRVRRRPSVRISIRSYMNDLWLLDSQQWTWRQLRPHGKGPEPRRKQSVCRVGSQIFLFGGTSPHEGPHVHFTQEQLQFMPDNQPKNLIDHNDTYVLDLKPSLRSLCMDFVIQNSHHYNLECLPQGIKYDIDCMTKDDTISEPLKFKGLPLG